MRLLHVFGGCGRIHAAVVVCEGEPGRADGRDAGHCGSIVFKVLIGALA